MVSSSVALSLFLSACLFSSADGLPSGKCALVAGLETLYDACDRIQTIIYKSYLPFSPSLSRGTFFASAIVVFPPQLLLLDFPIAFEGASHL